MLQRLSRACRSSTSEKLACVVCTRSKSCDRRMTITSRGDLCWVRLAGCTSLPQGSGGWAGQGYGETVGVREWGATHQAQIILYKQLICVPLQDRAGPRGNGGDPH